VGVDAKILMSWRHWTPKIESLGNPAVQRDCAACDKGSGSAYARNCHHPCLFPPSPLLFYFVRTCRDRTVGPRFVFYGSKDVFLPQLRLFWVLTKKLIFSTIFRKNTRNSLFA